MIAADGLLITWGQPTGPARKYAVVRVPRWVGRLVMLVVSAR